MSLQSKLVRKLMTKMLNMNKPLPEIRQDFRSIKVKKKMKSTTYTEQVEIAGVPCYWVVPEGCHTEEFIFYLHGGGYCLEAYEVGRQRTVHLAEFFGLSVLMIDYPVAPENPFPTAILKVNENYEKVALGKRVVLLGESCGCGLGLNLLVHLREKKLDMPVCGLFLTPFLDATLSNESHQKMKDVDPYYCSQEFNIVNYYTKGLNVKDPLVSPLFQEVHDLTPILIHVAELDTLSDDGTLLYNRLKEVNGKVEYEKWLGMWHVFHMNDDMVPEAKRAMKACDHFIKAHLGM